MLATYIRQTSIVTHHLKLPSYHVGRRWIKVINRIIPHQYDKQSPTRGKRPAHLTGRRGHVAVDCRPSADGDRWTSSECEGLVYRQLGTTERTSHRTGRASTLQVQWRCTVSRLQPATDTHNISPLMTSRHKHPSVHHRNQVFQESNTVRIGQLQYSFISTPFSLHGLTHNL